MLLSPTSVARASEVSFLYVRYLVKYPSGYVFNFSKNTATSKNGKSTNPVKFALLEENKNLCVRHHVDLQLEKRKEWHDNESQLILSFVEPHEAVSTSTISRWIIAVLQLLGVDANTSCGQSTRSASSLKAKAVGFPTIEIIKRDHWSNSSALRDFTTKQ